MFSTNPVFEPIENISFSGKEEALETFLRYLQEIYGFDFTYYKRPSLMRRIGERIKIAGVESYQNYIDYLQAHPEESSTLVDFIRVNYTQFFRNGETWDYIATECIPQIIADKKSDELIKVWSAGCASGEETYSLAILLLEALGVEEFHQRVQIYGTDIDAHAIQQAIQGIYSQHQVVGVPPAFLERYFTKIDESYIFCKDLRRPIIFAKFNLLDHAPISKVDLLLCRNILMYFNSEGQKRALYRLHFGLRENGILVLGDAEGIPIGIENHLFSAIYQKRRIYQKLPVTYTAEQLVEAFKLETTKKPKIRQNKNKSNLENPKFSILLISGVYTCAFTAFFPTGSLLS